VTAKGLFSIFSLIKMIEKVKTNINNNMGLQNLLNEPQRLATESDRLNLELENLVLDNYRIFVENLTCSVHLRVEVADLVLL
jgi:hypothetical protein